MKFIKTDSTETIKNLRTLLYQILTAPIDAMWEELYIGSSQHYQIKNNGNTIGYCCINNSGCLVQLFILEKYTMIMAQVVAELIESKLITSASLSSNEPISFNACLSLSKGIKTNTFCFEHSNTPMDIETSLHMNLAKAKDIPLIKVFLKEQVGMDDTFGYTEDLVSREAIFIVKESNVILATSECRISNSQPEIADLGIIVNKDFQGKGYASQLMQIQVNRVLNANKKPICSTTLDNIASRKAIEKSGFYCSNIIFDMDFTDH